uniref:Conotoxin Superfamily O1 n=1 Tax=Rhabditophanes sp. KR3021 TaxID=114890 RepID=A0AC35UAD4_9BILA
MVFGNKATRLVSLILLLFIVIQMSKAASFGEYMNNYPVTGKRASLLRTIFNEKRGNDFCGCNLGCNYRSFNSCSSCCSLAI